MFQEFPYTDMHQLNLDWIIKIAKDFLDQYTHLQELITSGETSLENITSSGLEQLQDKAGQKTQSGRKSGIAAGGRRTGISGAGAIEKGGIV